MDKFRSLNYVFYLIETLKNYGEVAFYGDWILSSLTKILENCEIEFSIDYYECEEDYILIKLV